MRVTGSMIVFQGFLVLYEEGKDEPENGKSDERLPDLSQDQPLDLLGIEPKQHFTQPPAQDTRKPL